MGNCTRSSPQLRALALDTRPTGSQLTSQIPTLTLFFPQATAPVASFPLAVLLGLSSRACPYLHAITYLFTPGHRIWKYMWIKVKDLSLAPLHHYYQEEEHCQPSMSHSEWGGSFGTRYIEIYVFMLDSLLAVLSAPQAHLNTTTTDTMAQWAN